MRLSILSQVLRAIIVWLVVGVISFAALWYGGTRLYVAIEAYAIPYAETSMREPSLSRLAGHLLLGLVMLVGFMGVMIPSLPIVGGLLMATRAAAWVCPRESAKAISGRPSFFTVLWVQLLSLVTFHWVYEWRRRRQWHKAQGAILKREKGASRLERQSGMSASLAQMGSEFDQILRLRDVGILRGWLEQKKVEIRSGQQQAADAALTQLLRSRRQLLEEMLGTKRASDVLQDYLETRELDQEIVREEKLLRLAELKARRQQVEAGLGDLAAAPQPPKPPLEEEEPDLERLASEGASMKMDSERAWKEWQERIQQRYTPWLSEQIIQAALSAYRDLPRY